MVVAIADEVIEKRNLEELAEVFDWSLGFLPEEGRNGRRSGRAQLGILRLRSDAERLRDILLVEPAHPQIAIIHATNPVETLYAKNRSAGREQLHVWRADSHGASCFQAQVFQIGDVFKGAYLQHMG